MIKFLITHPIAVSMTFIALMILGIVGYKQLPVSLLPDVDIPVVTVQIIHEEYTARDMERNIVSKTRRVLKQCAGLSELSSETRDGYSLITLNFNYGYDVDYASIEVNENVDQLMDMYPEGFERPKVIKASATDLPVFFINVSNKQEVAEKDFVELSRFIKNVVRKRIEQLPEIAMVDVSGMQEPSISIQPNPETLKSLGISYNDLENYFSANNFQIGNIAVHDGHYRYNIRFATEMVSINDIRDIYIRTGAKIVQLKDIANVELTILKEHGQFFSNGNRAISMAVIKQADAKMQELNQNLEKLINRIRRDYPDISFELIMDQTRLLNYSISNLKSTLLLGGALAFIVLLLFLTKIRLPLLMGITVPLSVIISMLFFMLFDISINVVSLSGLVLGIGMMIDNSIIVIDNITQYRERGENVFDATIKGVNEIIRPLLSSALTTSAVFIPLIFLSGVSGALFFDQALTVTIGLGVSFAVSITILPVVYHLLHEKSKMTLIKKRSVVNPESWYEKGFHWVFQHKTAALSGFLILLILAVILFQNIKKQPFPTLPETELIVNVDWNENINFAVAEKHIDDLSKAVRENYVTTASWIGMQDYLINKDFNLSADEAKIYFNTNNSMQANHLKEQLGNLIPKMFPGANFNIDPSGNIFSKTFEKREAPFILNIEMDEQQLDYYKVKEMATSLKQQLPVKTNTEFSGKQYQALSFDSEKLLLFGIGTNAMYYSLKTALNENRIGFLKTTGEVIPVFFKSENLNLKELLDNMTVKSTNGAEYQLMHFIQQKEKTDFKTIHANNEGVVVPFEFEVDSKNLPPLKQHIEQLLAKNFSDLEYHFSGSIIGFGKTMKELIVVLLISVILLYFILAAQFESITLPLIILLEIPIDIAGALLMVMAFGNSLNIMSAIGIIVMSGIIINDSILKIDTINQLHRKQGYNLMDAIHEAGKRRLRPILMTSITTIVALTPFLFSNSFGATLQKPLALAVIGGLGLGTIVSLYFIPLLYYYLMNGIKKMNKLKVVQDGSKIV